MKLKTQLPRWSATSTREEGRGSVFHSWGLNPIPKCSHYSWWLINSKMIRPVVCWPVLFQAVWRALGNCFKIIYIDVNQGQDVNKEAFIQHANTGRKESRVKPLILLNYVKEFFSMRCGKWKDFLFCLLKAASFKGSFILRINPHI